MRLWLATQFDLTVIDRNALPASGVNAVALNVTVADAASPNYLVVWPTGSTKPNSSNINVAGQPVSNEVIAKIGTGGKISMFFGGGAANHANVTIDITGYFQSTSDLQSLTPARLLDTRPGFTTVDGSYAGVGAVSSGGTLDVAVLGRGGIPSSGVTSVVVNVTATGPSAPAGYITVWQNGSSRPLASNLNFVQGQTIPNLVAVSPNPANGKISFFNSNGSTDLIADVVGYFTSNVTFSPLLPARLMDTRAGSTTIDGQYVGIGALANQTTLDLTVTGRGGVPATGVGAVALNVTATNPTAVGFLTAWGSGSIAGNAPPQAMGVNFSTGGTTPSLIVAPVGANGKVSIFNSSGSTDVIVDVVGWFPN